MQAANLPGCFSSSGGTVAAHSAIAIGQRVQQGQTIMSMGSTGNSTGPHVHFSIIINGVYVDPMRFLR